jgi:hypothetical protein
MARKKLKLYVWEEVLCDYTCGVIFALATDPEHARRLVMTESRLVQRTVRTEPREVTEAEGFIIYGGG